MPIAHIYMPKGQELIIPPEANASTDTLVEHVMGMGAVFNTYAPEQICEITPLHWQASGRLLRCVLEMKRSAEAAKIHVLSNESPTNSGLVIGSRSIRAVEGFRTVHIPAHISAVTLVYPAENDQLDFGTVVTRRTPDFFERYEEHWVESSPNQ